MKHLVLLLSLLVGLAGPAAAQIDTTGGQFHQPLYPTPTPTTVQYGSAVNSSGTTVALLMDVYQPVGGPATPRPVIILAHGGFFLGGTRAEYDVSELCRRFARLGYVTASIEYRLESIFSFNGARAVVNAVHDLRAAVRYFRQDAATANQYNVDPRYLFAGGSSAGAITAVHLAYLDKDAELAALNAPGVVPGVEGNSGNPGYSSEVLAAINLCGAIGNLSWIEAGDEPLVSLHGNQDATVPYGAGATFTGDVVYGSGAIKPRADLVGVSNTLYTFRGAGHVPYNGTNPTQQAYMDTTFRTVRDFLRPLLAVPSPLPVTVTEFRAEPQGAGVLLSWATAQEQNSAGFEVEASADGRQYQRLGFVASAAPNSTTLQQYRFRDEQPGPAGLRYYRLRQLDLDGTASYFGPRAVLLQRSKAALSLSVAPNPSSTDEAVAFISAPAELPAGAQLQVRDATGRLLFSRALKVVGGTVRVPLPQLAAQPAGVYVLELRAAGQQWRTRLVKQ
jgi:dienelactone hydrolase